MAQTIEAELFDQIAKLNTFQKHSLLSIIKTLAATEYPFSMQQYNREIEDAMIRMDAGQYISQKDVESEASGW